MAAPKERLIELLRLAAEGESARLKLVQELSEILIDWPNEYPSSARLPFEALLERTIREADEATRAAIVSVIARRGDAPIELLNQIYFAASPELKDHILACNDGAPEHGRERASLDEQSLLDAARNPRDTFRAALSRAIGVSREIAEDIVHDPSGQALAIVCKGSRTKRAIFSALAVLTDGSRDVEEIYRKLASYDPVPVGAAEHLLAFWLSQNRRLPPVIKRAAE